MNKAYIGQTLSSMYLSSGDFTLDQDGPCKHSFAEVGEMITRRQPVDIDSLPTALKYRVPALRQQPRASALFMSKCNAVCQNQLTTI